ncbi:MAG: type II secretion system protein GspK, partial [bacterium]
NLGVEEDPTDAILDWVDPDDNAEPAGAESDYYESMETPYTCKNGPMDSIEDVLLIAGIPAELYFDARYLIRGKDMDESEEEEGPVSLPDLLTVHGNLSGAVNVNTAHPEVLAALLENGAAIEDIMQMRIEEPFRTLPDFYSRAGITAPQQQGKGTVTGDKTTAPKDGAKANEDEKQRNPDDEKQKLTDPNQQSQGPFAVQSNVFRIFGDGQAGDVMVRVEAYVFRLGSQSPMTTHFGLDTKTNPAKDGKDKNGSKDKDKDKDLGDKKAKGESESAMESFRILDWRVIR